MDRKLSLFKRNAIKAVCALTSDRITLEIARFIAFKPDGRASQHLDHYFLGEGSPLKVNLIALFREDRGVQSAIVTRLIAALKRDRPRILRSITVPVYQSTYVVEDWKYALGKVDLRLEIKSYNKENGEVRFTISMRDKYDWHPEDNRITQCIHKAADDLRVKEKAHNYFREGKAVMVLKIKK